MKEVKKVANLSGDIAKVSSFLKKRKEKSYKERYEERLKEIEKEKVDEEYKKKLEELDKQQYGEGVSGKIKKGLKEFLK